MHPGPRQLQQACQVASVLRPRLAFRGGLSRNRSSTNLAFSLASLGRVAFPGDLANLNQIKRWTFDCAMGSLNSNTLARARDMPILADHSKAQAAAPPEKNARLCKATSASEHEVKIRTIMLGSRSFQWHGGSLKPCDPPMRSDSKLSLLTVLRCARDGCERQVYDCYALGAL